MILYFKNRGYSQVGNDYEFVKDSWTIRVTDEYIEAFDNIGKEYTNKYICVKNTEENLFEIVNDILGYPN